MKLNRLILFLGLVVLFEGCWISAGTHGSIKSYTYPVSKHELQNAVDIVLSKHSNINRDLTDNVIFDVTNPNKVDTIHNNYYNDGKRYITIEIKKNAETFEYTFQFSGTEADWESSKSSNISIAYAWDGNGNGGSEGNGGFNFRWGLKRKITKIFELEFLDKIDKQLGKPHTEAD